MADQGIAAWFVKKKSCLTNLLVVLEEITDYLDFGKSGYPVDVIRIFREPLTGPTQSTSFEISST